MPYSHEKHAFSMLYLLNCKGRNINNSMNDFMLHNKMKIQKRLKLTD